MKNYALPGLKLLKAKHEQFTLLNSASLFNMISINIAVTKNVSDYENIYINQQTFFP